MKTGAKPMIHPVFTAVVYFNPVICIHKWKTAISASNRILICFLKSIEKSLLVANAITNKNTTAKMRRIIIIVTGVNSDKAILVATNEQPQDITANNNFQYIRILVFSLKPFCLFLRETINIVILMYQFKFNTQGT